VRRRRHVEDWEQLRPTVARQHHPYPHSAARFEEVESDDEEEDGDDDDEDEEDEGVLLDPNGYRDGPRYVSDELYFTGYDLGQDRPHRHQHHLQYPLEQPLYDPTAYGEYYDSEEDTRPHRLSKPPRTGAAYQITVREKEDALIASAMSRIGRARAKGKTNVHLSPDEMEALERRRGGQPPTTNPSQSLVSPPATPVSTKKAAAHKSSSGSRSGSATNLNQKASSSSTKKKGSSGTSSPAKSNSKAKMDRKPLPPSSTSTSVAEHALPYPPGIGSPGIMVPGPNGVPVFAPIVNYTATPPSPEYVRGSRRGESPRSGGGPGAYFPASLRRPASSSSARSLPDEVDWLPPPSLSSSSSSPKTATGGRRNRSFSNAPAPGAVLPAAQGGGGARRNVSAPMGADVRYAGLPWVRRPGVGYMAGSDPTLVGGRLEHRVGSSASAGSSSSGGEGEDQGVQVEVVVQDGGDGGYVVNRVPVETKGGGDGGGRRKKGRK